MDFKSGINFIAEHYVVVTGSTLALFFATSMVLLIRSIGKKDEANLAPAAIDAKEIEEVMQRVLATHTPQIAAAPTPGEEVEAEVIAEAVDEAVSAQKNANAEAIEELKKMIAEYEASIARLTKELDDVKATAVANEAMEPKSPEEDVGALKDKLAELQAKLAEYEIIEDDIADLSQFKEENARLKEELAKLKGGGAVSDPEAGMLAAEIDASRAAAQSEAPPAFDAAQEALIEEVKTAVEGGIAAGKSDRFELDINDEIMKEFATAVEVKNAPPPDAMASIPSDNADMAVFMKPEVSMVSEETSTVEEILSDAPDTDKILEEVQAADAASPEESVGDVLADSLDTDKLLAEVSILNASVEASEEASDLKKAQNG